MASAAQDGDVRIELLGGFRVAIGGDEVVADVWPGRRAAELVQRCWRLPTGTAVLYEGLGRYEDALIAAQRACAHEDLGCSAGR